MIKGKKVNLRAINEEDLGQIKALKNDVSEVGEYATLSIPSMTQLKEMYHEHGMIKKDLEMLIIANKENEIVGMVQRAKQQSYATGFEIGFLIYRSADRNKGYASEALNLFTAYIFEAYPIERLEIGTHIDNIGAQKVAEKCGYIFEGINRKACYIRGVAADLKRYSIIRKEAKALKDILG